MTNLYLIGMPGCGKTTLGKALATALGREFMDLDAYIEQTWGMSIPQIFAAVGEAGFRQKETAALRQAAENQHGVIATGGGIVLRQQNQGLMKQSGQVIFVDRPLALLLEETDASCRPLLAGDKRQRLQQLYQQRIALYRQAADLTLLNDGTLEQGLARLLALLQ